MMKTTEEINNAIYKSMFVLPKEYLGEEEKGSYIQAKIEHDLFIKSLGKWFGNATN